jgi:hypothetical protein
MTLHLTHGDAPLGTAWARKEPREKNLEQYLRSALEELQVMAEELEAAHQETLELRERISMLEGRLREGYIAGQDPLSKNPGGEDFGVPL